MLRSLLDKGSKLSHFEGAKGGFRAGSLGKSVTAMVIQGECDDEMIEPFDAALTDLLDGGVEFFVDASDLDRFSAGFRDAALRSFLGRRACFYRIHALYTRQAVGMAMLAWRMQLGKQLRTYNQRDPFLDALDSARISDRFAGMGI